MNFGRNTTKAYAEAPASIRTLLDNYFYLSRAVENERRSIEDHARLLHDREEALTRLELDFQDIGSFLREQGVDPEAYEGVRDAA